MRNLMYNGVEEIGAWGSNVCFKLLLWINLHNEIKLRPFPLAIYHSNVKYFNNII